MIVSLPPEKKRNDDPNESHPKRTMEMHALTVENRPPPSARHINPIIYNRRQDIIQIPLIVITPPQIPQDRLQTRELRLKRLREPKLRHLDIRHTREQVLGDLAQELADSRGIIVEPVGSWVRRRTYRKPVWGYIRRADAFRVAGGGGIADACFGVFEAVDVVGSIRVYRKEIRTAPDHVFFLLGQGREVIAEGVFEGLGIVAVVPL